MSVGLPLIATLAGMFSVAYSLRFVMDVFFGPPCTTADVPRVPHEPPRWMRVPGEVLVLICLVVGIVPVRMRMPHPFVAVLMLMLLRYMQPDARGHQHCRNPEQQAGLLTEQQ